MIRPTGTQQLARPRRPQRPPQVAAPRPPGLWMRRAERAVPGRYTTARAGNAAASMATVAPRRSTAALAARASTAPVPEVCLA